MFALHCIIGSIRSFFKTFIIGDEVVQRTGKVGRRRRSRHSTLYRAADSSLEEDSSSDDDEGRYTINLATSSSSKPRLRSIRPSQQTRTISSNESKRMTNNASSDDQFYHEEYEDPSLFIAVITYCNYSLLAIFSYFREFLRRIGVSKDKCAIYELESQKHFVPLYADFEALFTRWIYRRIRDCWNRPIASAPGAHCDVVDRVTLDFNQTYSTPGTKTRAINVGSYNYLGFAQNTGPCAEKAAAVIKKFGLASCSTRQELGNITRQKVLENLVAKYVGVEDAVCFPMGFATNSMNIPCFVGKGCLILSDELNHASLILGCRLSKAEIKVFRHNDMKQLESRLRTAIVEGQPRTHRPYKKILIFVEGVYSMEGSIVRLPEVIALKKKYKAYLYLDEAHSIGALGKNGAGVCDYFGCDPTDVDILMGTFTKSFGSAGGYIAGRKQVIDYLRLYSHSACYAGTMGAPVIEQIIAAMSIILGLDSTVEGKSRINQLARNANYFRKKLKQRGFIVLGNDNSPVVPLMMYQPGKIAALSRTLLEKYNVAVVCVGFPATKISGGRVRFCLSAAHTKAMLDQVLDAMEQIADLFMIRYSRESYFQNEEILY